MNTKVDQLFQNIYNDTTQYIDSNFIDGDRNVGRLNSAKKITLSKEIVSRSFRQIIKKDSKKNKICAVLVPHALDCVVGDMALLL